MVKFLQKIKGKLKKPSKKGLILGLVVLLCAAGAVIYFVTSNTSKSAESNRANCDALSGSVNELIKQKKYEEAYTQAKSKTDDCGTLKEGSNIQDPAKTGEYVGNLTYQASLAQAAFAAGDKEQAKIYAQQVIKLNTDMTPDQRSQIPNQNDILMDMFDIEAGTKRPVEEGR